MIYIPNICKCYFNNFSPQRRSNSKWNIPLPLVTIIITREKNRRLIIANQSYINFQIAKQMQKYNENDQLIESLLFLVKDNLVVRTWRSVFDCCRAHFGRREWRWLCVVWCRAEWHTRTAGCAQATVYWPWTESRYIAIVVELMGIVGSLPMAPAREPAASSPAHWPHFVPRPVDWCCSSSCGQSGSLHSMASLSRITIGLPLRALLFIWRLRIRTHCRHPDT